MGLPVAEQILIVGGVKLDGTRPLNAYGLPSANPNKHVFLYNKAWLKPGSAPPPAEPFVPIHIEGASSRNPLRSTLYGLLRNGMDGTKDESRRGLKSAFQRVGLGARG
jgi:hypothetical protein